MSDIPSADFSLIETMRWEAGTGIVRLRLHLARLTRSAGRLGFQGADRAAETLNQYLTQHLNRTLADIPEENGPLRVRLCLSPCGDIEIVTAPFKPLEETTVWRVAVAHTRLSSADKLLRHKTTRRAIYETARSEYLAAQADEVLLLNEKDEPCEGTITSIFLDDGSGILKTPPISNGLLAGVLRTELICQRRARVQRLTLDDIGNGTLYVGNSLRGLIRSKLVQA